MERQIDLGEGARGTVSLSEPVLRYTDNPILTSHQVNEAWRTPRLQVVTVHNAGAAVVGAQTLLLFRSHLRPGLSVLGLARSDDGVTGWAVDPRPVLVPAGPGDRYGAHVDPERVAAMESGGVEDARINPVDGGGFAITYSAYDGRVPNQVRVALATTDDFAEITRHGPMLERDMRNVVLFPERIDGRYVGLFRPNDTAAEIGGAYTQIHIGYADDLRSGPWTIEDEPIMRTGAGPSAFSDKIGPGAPPVRTRHGWLNLFHGVRTTMDGNPYVLGVALHDADDPRTGPDVEHPGALPNSRRLPGGRDRLCPRSERRVLLRDAPACRRQPADLLLRQRHGAEPRLLARGRPGRAVPALRSGPAHRRAALRPVGRFHLALTWHTGSPGARDISLRYIWCSVSLT